MSIINQKPPKYTGDEDLYWCCFLHGAVNTKLQEYCRLLPKEDIDSRIRRLFKCCAKIGMK